MLTRSAATARAARDDICSTIQDRASLRDLGYTADEIRAQIDAGRWRSIGLAVVLHNGEPARHELWHAAAINCGPRAVLTSFTALESGGLTSWPRDEIHVLAPAGAARPSCALPIVLHRTRLPIDTQQSDRCHKIAPAALLAAASFSTPRPAAGVVAASVQQGLTTTDDLRDALSLAPRIRHRAILAAAMADIAMGSEALSEIDFVRLCRRAGLPAPVQQAVRVEPNGRRRYLDAEWVRPDGRTVAVEVDGAIHLAADRWFADQLRQNEISLSGTLVLRFPAVVVRTEPTLVVAQLRRALGISRSS